MLAYVFGSVGILFIPILFGVAGIACAAVAKSKQIPGATAALTFAIIATVVGMVIGVIVYTTL